MSDYKSLFKGSRPYDAVEHLAVDHDDINEFQDQHIEAFTKKQIGLTYNGRVADTAVANWLDWQTDADVGYMSCAVNNRVLIIPIPTEVGEEICEVEVQITGTVGALGGAAYYRAYDSTTPGQTIVNLFVPGDNAWDTGGVAYANVDTYTEDETHGSLPLTVATGSHHFLMIVAPTNAAASPVRLWWASASIRRE